MRAIISFSLVIILSTSAGAADLSTADREAVQRVYDQYVVAWLSGDSHAVMRLLSEDAVLIPHHGLPPVVGARAIREWWWPPDSPPTTINVFTVTYDQVGGSGRMAFVRGTQRLEWTTGTKKSRNRGNHLTLMRKERDGRWLITHQMWGDPANEPVN